MKSGNLTYLTLIAILLSSFSLNGTVLAASSADPGNGNGAKPVCPGPAAPGAKILLVEASSNSFANLLLQKTTPRLMPVTSATAGVVVSPQVK